MIREPKMLPWLAKRAGVPLPVARAIWQDVAKESEATKKPVGDLAWRQVRELRRQLRAWAKAGPTPQRRTTWVFPVPVYRAWADCQTRFLRSTWLAWAGAAHTTSRLSRVRRYC